ncbi:TonB-dependent receptor plug domain-containing protein [Marivirga harenae]|uniref:TonB-dependent receptor n=1 Tax=Marivirga harenae TaxID=2010992 RepID=UPI0026DF7422|nr:TonB-dependent receptor plug domain-containing protein [Marivirga harenae]WKV10648.1 TonB-dependent receptor plug domain-containing protein [Marivirga harenae]|tara:strand:+ start:9353 stop:11689 length:2337 start_codon:yes stop_codon:yes gene_type:complete
MAKELYKLGGGKHIILLLLFIMCFSFLKAQNIQISGYLTEEESNQPVQAALYLNHQDEGLTSNSSGFFTFPWQAHQTLILEISSSSHERKVISFKPKSDTLIYINMKAITLEEVVAKANKTEVARSSVSMDIEKLRSIPPVMGEADILKTFTLFPGIAAGNEGTTGLFVRGGTPDQNLLLLDEAVIFNPSHLLGFISVFNQNAIESATVYKGNFPSKYGGRLSSIVDVEMKDGSESEERKGSLSIGLLSSNIFLSGNREKFSYMLSGRSTYLTLASIPNKIRYTYRQTDSKFNYWMEDVNAKINFEPIEDHKMTFSVYQTGDYFTTTERDIPLTNELHIDWGNQLVSLKHTGLLKNNFIIENSFTYSRYKYQLEALQSNEQNIAVDTAFANSSATHNVSLKSQLNKEINQKLALDIGLQQQYYFFNPRFYNKTIDNTDFGAQCLWKTGLFLDLKYDVSDYLMINGGYRHSFYLSGSDFYTIPEPRISIDYQWSSNLNLNLGFTKMAQPIHLLNSSSGLPNDNWVPAGENIRPAIAYQINGGFSRAIPSLNGEFSMEGYAKRMNDLIDYPYGYSFYGIAAGPLDEIVEKEGIGEAYGIETYFEMQKDNFSGWLSYTYSFNTRQFEGINEGTPYFANFDRRHDLSLSVNYKASQKWNFNAVWNLQSGRPFTAPSAIIRNPGGLEQVVYGPRNNSRLPVYHRLDLGAEYSFTKKDRDRKWSFGIINAYNRVNPFYYRLFPKMVGTNSSGTVDYFENQYTGQGFLPFLPYVSYQFNLFKNRK